MTKAPRPSSEATRRGKRWALGGFRLGIIFAAFALLRALPEKPRSLDRGRILTEAWTALPAAASMGEPAEGMFPLLDATGETLGWATTTFPQAEKIQGYSGPSELLVIFDARRTVRAVRFLESADTAGHVRNVRDDPAFWEQWNGKSEAVLGAANTPRIVTGASLTSEAMARGIAARFGAQGMEQWFPDPLTLPQIAKWYPAADRIEELKTPGEHRIWNAGVKLGTVLRSSRMGVSARGFNGTSDVIVALDPSGEKILGIGFLGSRDNEPYISDTREEVKYADGFAGKSVAEIMAGDPEKSEHLIVSGASYTASAVIESVHEMLRRHRAAAAANRFPWTSMLALSWIGLGVLAGVTKRGGHLKARLAFAVISVAAGVTLGWMVSQDQLIGWAENGLDWRGTLPLLMLTAVALMVPAFTGKNVYCSRICPHGAAQTLAGQAFKKRHALPAKLHMVLVRMPWLMLLVIWLLAFLGSGIPFAWFEPFETWSSGFTAFIPATIFTVGLLAAFFLPQAYCHYGCPTGALLKFLTHAPGRWTAKDSVAGGLIAIAACFVMFQ